MEATFTKSPSEIIADVLSRYSVLDLRELSDADLDRADKMLEKQSDRPLTPLKATIPFRCRLTNIFLRTRKGRSGWTQ